MLYQSYDCPFNEEPDFEYKKDIHSSPAKSAPTPEVHADFNDNRVTRRLSWPTEDESRMEWQISHSDYESCTNFEDDISIQEDRDSLPSLGYPESESSNITVTDSDVSNTEVVFKDQLRENYLNKYVKLPNVTSLINKSIVERERRIKIKRSDLVASDEEELVPGIDGDWSSEPLPPHLETVVSFPVSETVVTNTYCRRFWIISVFSLYTFFTCLQWNAWGPISASVIVAFPDWSFRTVAWMESWVTVMFVIFMLPVCWTTERFGLRTGILLSSIVLAIGLALRCITDKSPFFTIYCHVCSVMLGFSTTVVLSSPSMVAAEWFPSTERTTATAFIMAASQLGSVGSYLEPLFVPQPNDGVPLDLIKNAIMKLMYIMAGCGGIMFIIFVAYFPSKPPRPPSIASGTERHSFGTGFLLLLTDKNLMTLIFIYGIASGPALGWIGMLNYSLQPLGFDQNESMMVGLTGVFMCFLASVITGWVTDRLFGYLRETIIILLLLAASSFYWFLLLSHNVIPVDSWQVYASVSLGLSFHYATITLFYELASELAYPAPEVLVGGFITCADCLSTSLFLFTYLFNLGFQWVTYVLVCSNALPVLGLLFVKDGYKRSKLDRQKMKYEE